MAIAHLQSSPLSGGEGCSAPDSSPTAVGLDLDRGRRDLLDLRRKGFLTAEQVVGVQQRFLLDAVAEVVAEYGYGGLTVNRVTARAGVSRLTLYQLYPDLDACLLAAVHRAHGLVREAVAVGYAHEPDGAWGHRVHGAVVEVLCLLDAQPALARLCAVEALCGPGAVRAAHHALIADLAAALTSAAGQSEPGLPACVAEGLVGGGWAMLYQRLATHEDHPSLLELAGEMSYLLCAAFQGPAAAEPLLHRAAHPVRDWGSPTPASAEGVKWRAEKAGLGVRKQILQFVSEHPGASNVQIAEHQGVGQSTISRRLRTLARDGLLRNEQRTTTNTWHVTAYGLATLAA